MPSLIPLGNMLGAALIGIILSTVVYGITCLQVYLYYTQHCSKDRWPLKIYVAVIMALDTSHVALLATFFYHYTVTNFGDYSALSATTWSLLVQVAIGTALEIGVQCFFAYRVYQLSNKSFYVPITICLICLGQIACTIGYLITGFREWYFTNDASGQVPYSIGSLTLNVVCDVTISASMIHLLRKLRTPFYNTKRAVNLLVIWALNTCLLTTIFTVICLGVYLPNRHNLLFVPFYFIVVRLYSCSFMSTLNSRENIRRMLHDMVTNTISLPAMRPEDIGDSAVSAFAAVKYSTPESDMAFTP